MRKFAVMILGASLISSMPAQAQPQLSDISNHWALESINKAIQDGFVDGYEDNTFRPEKPVSRAEFVKMIADALKLKHPSAWEGAWYQPYVSAAVEAGVHRYEDFDQDISSPITRQEMTRLVLRATNKELRHPDVHMNDKAFIYNATKAGLIQGLDGGDLALNESTTRAQAVTVVDRVLQTNAGKQQPVDKYAVSNAELALKKTNIFTVAPDLFGGKTEGSVRDFELSPWNINNFLVETSDGNYKGFVEEVIVIDFEDDNDPNLNLLGDFEQLYWSGGGTRITYPVKSYRQSYGIVVKTTMVFNKDENVYGSVSPLISIQGIQQPDNLAFRNGELNTTARFIFDNKMIDRAFLIPKHNLKTYGFIEIQASAPAIPPNNKFQRPLIRANIAEFVQ